MSEIDNILEILLREKSIIMSNNLNALIRFATALASNALKWGKNVIIVDEQGFFERYIPLDLVEKVAITSNLKDACGDLNALLLVLVPKSPYKLKYCRSPNVIAFTKPFRALGLHDYAKYRLKRVPGTSEYLLYCYEKGVSARILLKIRGIKLVESPPGIYGKAYEILKNTLSSYGEVMVKDAVRAISLELGVDKKRAKSIIIALARRGYVRVIKGKIALT